MWQGGLLCSLDLLRSYIAAGLPRDVQSSRFLRKWVRIAQPNRMYVASKIQNPTKHFASFSAVGSIRFSNLSFVLQEIS